MNHRTIMIASLFVIVIVMGILVYKLMPQGYTVMQGEKNKTKQSRNDTGPARENAAPEEGKKQKSVKIYRSDVYGFSLSYPSEMIMKEESLEQEPGPGGVVHAIDLGRGMTLQVAKIEEGLMNAEDPLAAPNGMEPVSQEEIEIDGEKARSYNDSTVIVTSKDGYQFIMSFEEEGTDPAAKEDFSKVVASFKFME